MHEGIDLLAEPYPRCFCSTNRRPLKIGVCELVISQRPEMSRHRIKRLLKTYTQCPEYWCGLIFVALTTVIASMGLLAHTQTSAPRWRL